MIAVILWVMGETVGASCPDRPMDLFLQNPHIQTAYECGRAGEAKLCSEPTLKTCRPIQLKTAIARLDDPGGSGRPLSEEWRRNLSPEKKVAAVYLSAVHFPAGIFESRELVVQTGPYGQLKVSSLALNSRCMATIVQAAYKLHSFFPNYNFVIDSQIHNCHNLRDGIKQLVAQRQLVKRNLDQFHSPLHSIFLTNRSGYEARQMGRMGLHVNVDQPSEIRRRLIDFKVPELSKQSLPLQARSGL